MLSTGNPHTDAALADAVTSRNRRVLWSLTADVGRTGKFDHPWSDLSGLVSDLTINRALAGDLPAETTLVEGFASASLTATLEGRIGAHDVIDLFGAYRGNPQWAGVAVRFDLGLDTRFGPVLLRQFTGTVRAVTSRTAARTVTLTAADGADSLRAGVTLPVAGADGIALAALGESRYRPWMNTQWVIDTALRANAVYNSPAPLPSAILSATCHGSLAPEIGTYGSPYSTGTGGYTGPLWTPGKFGLLAANGGGPIPLHSGAYITTARVTFQHGTALGLGAFVHCGTEAKLPDGLPSAGLIEVNAGMTRLLRLTLNDTGTVSLIVRDGAKEYIFNHPTVLPGQAWRYIGVHVQFVGDATTINTVVMRWNLDGVITNATLPVSLPANSSTTYPAALAGLNVLRPISNVQVWNATQQPLDTGWPDKATSVSDIDPGLGELTHLPTVAGQDSWDLIKEVAAAEYAVAGFNENGRFFFLNRDTLTARRALPPTSTVDDNTLKDVSATISMDTVRNEITASAIPAYTGGQVPVITATALDEWNVNPRSTVARTVPLPDNTVSVLDGFNTAIPPIATADWNRGAPNGYCAARADGTGTDVSSVFVTVAQTTPTNALVTVKNDNFFAIRLSTTGSNPQPALRIAGLRITAAQIQTATVTDSASIQTNRRRSLSLPSSRWRHRIEPLRALAAKLLGELAKPRPVLDEIPVVGDPRRTLLDTVTLSDPTGLGTTTASVVAITRHLSVTDGLSDSITVRPTT
ncbi:hypothetical protein P3102_22630 [Amycolatopsis sp. QT-25]|uniref:hypothetical protein n=1 Tax=Amycolatopsis sp. QT-25 TaxID=3034022 RepID=UPI0023ECEA4C|nr:hypothetical protein [Amycolatopsis sp. QT-25]WET76902.1 hypothetical protein P3102_22630 [Amycolatopsis sp. QT-25]